MSTDTETYICPEHDKEILRGENGHLYCPGCEEDKRHQWAAEQLRRHRATLLEGGLVRESTLDYPRQFTAGPENEAAYKNARAALNARKSLYVHGPVGCGKSHLGRVVLSIRIKRLDDVAEITGVAFGRLAAKFDPGQLYEDLKEVRFLLLDDLDKMPMTPAAVGALWEVLDFRYEYGLPTIITANVSPAELVATIGNDHLCAALDRLKPVQVIELTGASLRGVVPAGTLENI